MTTYWLRTPAAALHCGLAPATMKTMRARGRGPRYRVVGGAVLYAVADLDGWIGRPECVRETADSLALEAPARRRRREHP